ncbi:MAG: hypothetical protein GY940_04540 [bacterium]|nr:hypothetical protein [bacterium]
MAFIRKIINSNLLEDIIEIPVELKNKEMELLLIPMDTGESKNKEKFDPREFRGVTNIDEETLNGQIKSIREEWDRFD